MNNTAINIKTNLETKEQAQKVADELGFSLSSLINAYLKQLVRTKRVEFAVQEEPSAYFISQAEKSAKDMRKDNVSPAFSDADEAISWLQGPLA